MSAPDARPPVLCSRRAVLRGAGASAVLAPGALLAACSPSSEAGETAADTASQARVPAAEVPVGEATVLEAGGDEYVLVQAAEGEFAAYSAVCTHQGGALQADEGTVVVCVLHGSRFDAGDGAAVLNGPAEEPLEEVPVTVDGDELVLG